MAKPLKIDKPNKKEILKRECEMNMLSAKYECLTLEEFFEFLKELIDEYSDDSQKIHNLGFKYFIMCSALNKAYEIIEEIERAKKQPDWSKRKKLETVREIEAQAQQDYDEYGNIIL